MRASIPLAMILISYGTLANGQTQEQKNVMEHLAVLHVAAKWCSDYSVNVSDINEAAASSKIRPDRAPFKEYLKVQIDKTQDALSETGVTAGCAGLYSMYGPKGSAVSGQMMKR